MIDDELLQYITEQSVTWDKLGFDAVMIRARPLERGSQSITESSLEGNVLQTINPNQILTGKITASSKIDVGSIGRNGYVRLDGENNRIIINDGTVDRILIGYLKDGF